MSDLYLAAALTATFGAVASTVLVWQSGHLKRQRAVDVLRSQVKETAAGYRERQLSDPFMQRALVPLVAKLGDAARKLTPLGMRERIRRKIVLAGSPPGLEPDKVAAAKVFGAAGAAGVALLLATLGGIGGSLRLTAAVFFGLLGYLIPGASLGQKAIGRQDAIRKALPDTIDLLTISVEAGLGFNAALAHVRRTIPGALSDEIGRVLQEIQLGVPRVEAFRHLAERSDVEELGAFILAVTQADAHGVSMTNVLRAQAREVRMKRRQRAEELAMKIPVKLLFPLIFGILPALFVVMLGPGVIRVLQTFLGR